jgi:CheY-like chemotaxis protein
MSARPRVIVASPLGAETEFLADWLTSEGLEPVKAVTPAGALAAITARPFDLLLADAGFAFKEGLDVASRPHRKNSLTPTIVIGDTQAAETQADVRGAMYVRRPVDRATLVCCVTMAMMDERPVRCSLRKRVERMQVVVDGTKSHIIDVSPEGLRIEIPSDRRSTPPPYFSVRVPIIGVGLIVQRMWSARRSATVSWYGGALARNSTRVELAWRNFVDAIPSSGQSLEIQ